MAPSKSGPDIDFCTFGMFIIDEIEFESPHPPVKDIMGGAGAYAAVGARMVAGEEHSKNVGWIVDAGSDFPTEIRHIIDSWDTHCILREDAGRLTTRAWNGYGPNEKRDFKYLTPKIRLDHNALTESLLFSKSFHMVCSPARCCEIIQGVLERRQKYIVERGDSISMSQRPVFIWEPVPDLCRPEELSRFYDTLKYVDVVSPNEHELAQLFDRDTWDKESNEVIADSIVKAGIGPDGDGVLVVRAGKDGCYAFSKNGYLQLPAYHDAKVVDPTGAGNAFLGAMAQGMVSHGRAPLNAVQDVVRERQGAWSGVLRSWTGDEDLPMVLICATVAASFAIEQIGMPTITRSGGGPELWNGKSYVERVREFAQHLLEPVDGS